MSTSMTAISVFVITALVSWLAIRHLIGYLISKDIVDRPNDRTLHQGAVPRGGGLIIVVGLLSVLAWLAMTSNRQVLFGCLTGVILAWAALSWWDDKYDLSAGFRLLVQLSICIFTVAALGWVNRVYTLDLAWLGPILSVIGLLWMANLYNFMDGLDGLAASQTIVASISLAFWFFVYGDNQLALICVVVAASSYGFLLWNWSPAKIFMGDVGSISLGGFFGCVFIFGVTRYDISIISFFALFAVFISDATVTILMRCLRREKIWQAHRQHFYQRLANAGYPHSKIALGSLLLMVISSFFATLGVIERDMIGFSLLAIVSILVAAAVLVIYLENRAHI